MAMLLQLHQNNVLPPDYDDGESDEETDFFLEELKHRLDRDDIQQRLTTTWSWVRLGQTYQSDSHVRRVLSTIFLCANRVGSECQVEPNSSNGAEPPGLLPALPRELWEHVLCFIEVESSIQALERRQCYQPLNTAVLRLEQAIHGRLSSLRAVHCRKPTDVSNKEGAV